MQWFFLFFVLFFPFSGKTIYNLKTSQENLPDTKAKHWLLLSQSCHSCAELIVRLETFCAGKKPSPSQIGFWAIGSSPSALLKKLKSFKSDYEIFSGSPNEFYETYKVMGAPSLKIKGKAQSIRGKGPILKYLTKAPGFCLVVHSQNLSFL